MKALLEFAPRRTPLRLIAPLVAALAFGIASCGDSSVSSSPDVASMSADELMSEVASALAGVRSYRVEGTMVNEDGRSRITAAVEASGSVRYSVAIGRTRARMVIVDSGTFIKANRAFLLAQDSKPPGTVVDMLSDRWVKTPPDAAKTKEGLELVLPKTWARCLAESDTTVTKKGTRQFAGRRVVVLADKGDTPGGLPSDLYVSATGPPLPLRVVQTGKERPGKADPRCGGDDDSSTLTASDLRYSDFNEPMHIAAPSEYLDLSQAGGASGAAA